MKVWIARVIAVIQVAQGAAGAAQVYDQVDEAQLRESVRTYLGTPYRYGGTSLTGIDCSGLTLSVYRDQGIVLPRTVREQFRVGESVRRSEIVVGDLVFFNTTGRGASHVGVALSRNSFVHGGTSTGVVEADLASDYWRRRYIGARRVATRSTYVVSGDEVGASAEDRVVVANRYPFTTYDLVDIPTNSAGVARAFALGFEADVAGDIVLNPRVTLWNRLLLGAYFPFDDLLGDGAPGVSRPDVVAKVRINDHTGHIPGFAIGYDSRRPAFVEETNYGDSVRTVNRRGLFLAASGNLTFQRGPIIGETVFHSGVGLATFRGIDTGEDIALFAGMRQHLFRRMALSVEVDNILGRRGAHVNAAAAMTITDDAVVKYAVRFLGRRSAQIDKVLTFSFSIPY